MLLSVEAQNEYQENVILCFIKNSIGYLITPTCFSFVSGLVGKDEWASLSKVTISTVYGKTKGTLLSVPFHSHPGHVSHCSLIFTILSSNMERMESFKNLRKATVISAGESFDAGPWGV